MNLNFYTHFPRNFITCYESLNESIPNIDHLKWHPERNNLNFSSIKSRWSSIHEWKTSRENFSAIILLQTWISKPISHELRTSCVNNNCNVFFCWMKKILEIIYVEIGLEKIFPHFTTKELVYCNISSYTNKTPIKSYS